MQVMVLLFNTKIIEHNILDAKLVTLINLKSLLTCNMT